MVAIVTGASSGIGRRTARALRERGCRVFDLSRRHIPQEGVTHIFADVTDENSVNAAVERILAEAGSIDVVANCAGFGISGAVDSRICRILPALPPMNTWVGAGKSQQASGARPGTMVMLCRPNRRVFSHSSSTAVSFRSMA